MLCDLKNVQTTTIILQVIRLNFSKFSVLLVMTEMIMSIIFLSPQAELNQEFCCTNALNPDIINLKLLHHF